MPRVAKAFREMDTGHLVCRQHHRWDLEVVEIQGTERWAHWSCDRCGLDKVIVYDGQGTRLRARAGRYPAGYLVKDVRQWGGRRELNRNVAGELINRFSKNGR